MRETLLSLEGCLDRLEDQVEMHSLDAHYVQRMRLAATDTLVFLVYAERNGQSYTVLAEGKVEHLKRKRDVLDIVTNVFSGVRPPTPVNAGYYNSLKLQLGSVLMAMVYYNTTTQSYTVIAGQDSQVAYNKQGVIPLLTPVFNSPGLYS